MIIYEMLVYENNIYIYIDKLSLIHENNKLYLYKDISIPIKIYCDPDLKIFLTCL